MKIQKDVILTLFTSNSANISAFSNTIVAEKLRYLEEKRSDLDFRRLFSRKKPEFKGNFRQQFSHFYLQPSQGLGRDLGRVASRPWEGCHMIGKNDEKELV